MASKFIYEVDDMAEGVYMASGDTQDDCWKITGITIHQEPDLGRGNHCIQIDAKHYGTHTCTNEVLIITFNQPVTFYQFEGNQPLSGDGTATLSVPCGKFKNGGGEPLGMGALYVIASTDAPLSVVSARMDDQAYRN